MTNSPLTPGIVPGRLPAAAYARNFADHDPALDAHEARVAADRCYFCHDAPCIAACPTSIDIPLFIRQIATGTPEAAATTIWTQNLRKGETTSGSASIRVEGVHEGELRALAWEALAQRKPEQAPAFSFKYFQELDVSFVLPEGFTPNRVVLVVKSAQGDQFERSFPWDQTLATGADEHVWK